MMPSPLIGMDIIMQRDLHDLVSTTLDRKFEGMPPYETKKVQEGTKRKAQERSHVPKMEQREDSGIFRGKSPGLFDMSSLKQSIIENIDNIKNKRRERRGSLDSFDSQKVRKNVRRVTRKGSDAHRPFLEMIDGTKLNEKDGATVTMPPPIKIVNVPSAA
jgi:hypothetical protein